jgi:hypothetical protein|eukprot:COSAG01_NODE_5106_length_4477_cov_19.011192_4_plen_83_part_00
MLHGKLVGLCVQARAADKCIRDSLLGYMGDTQGARRWPLLTVAVQRQKLPIDSGLAGSARERARPRRPEVGRVHRDRRRNAC